MKLAHLPGEYFAELWRGHGFEATGDFHVEDFDYAFSRAEAHVEGFWLDREYLFKPLQSLHFNMGTNDQARIGQKIIESAAHAPDYRWPEFEVWFADQAALRRLRKSKTWHLAGELWTVLVRLALWKKVVRSAVRYASTGRNASGMVQFDMGWNPQTDAFLKAHHLIEPLHHDDPRVSIDPPFSPFINLHLMADFKEQ